MCVPSQPSEISRAKCKHQNDNGNRDHHNKAVNDIRAAKNESCFYTPASIFVKYISLVGIITVSQTNEAATSLACYIDVTCSASGI